MTATRGTQSEIETAGTAVSPYGEDMVRYRFLDGMGDVMGERDFPGHAAALAWARDEEELDDEVQRVEYLGPEGDWRWAGAMMSA